MQMEALRAENLQPGMDVRFDSTGQYKVLGIQMSPTGPKSVQVKLRGSYREYVRTFRRTKLIGVSDLENQ